MWGNNEWTKSMFKKYWLVIIFIAIGCFLIVINNDGNLDIVPYTTKDDCFTDGKMFYWKNSNGIFKKTPLEFDGRLIAN